MLIPVKLKELGDIITGNTPSKKEISYWDSKDICFVKPDSISEQGISIVKNTTEYLSEKASSKARIVTKDAVFVTCIGTIGKIGLAAEGRYAFNQQINVVVPNTKVLPKYLAYALLSSKKRLEDIANAPVVPIINKTQFGEFSIKIEDNTLLQKDIVNILDKVVGIIDFRRRELQCLDNLVKARFVEMFGDPITNEKGWNVEELDSVCDAIGDGLHGTPEYDEDGKYPFINGNNLMNGVIEVTPSTKKVSEKTYKKYYIELTDNAILLSINGTLGKLAFYNGEEVMLGKSACYCNLKQKINREFVYGVMKTEAFTRFLERNATASTIKNVGLRAIRGFKLILPPEELQIKFVNFSRQIDKSKVVVPSKIKNTIFAIMLSVSFGQITSI